MTQTLQKVRLLTAPLPYGRGSLKHVALLLSFLVLGIGAASLIAADKPRLPVERKPEPVPEGRRRLAADTIEYAPPKGWTEATKSATPARNAFVSENRLTSMVIEVLPTGTQIDKTMAPMMMKKMKTNRAAQGQKYETEPKVEKDDRFILKIRERFTVKDRISDQLHLYRPVGSRIVLVLVNSLDEPATVKEVDELAEETSVSATAVKK